MTLARPSTVLLAALIDSPAIYHAAVAHDLPAMSALYRFLIAVPVAAVMLVILRSVTANYGHEKERPIRARSERLDTDGAAAPLPGQQPEAQPPAHPQGQPQARAQPPVPPQGALPG
jgi:hypothetical protein